MIKFKKRITKCNKLGHKYKTFTQTRREKPSYEKDLFHRRYVLVDVSYEITRCKRCNHQSEMKELCREGYNSVSMPKEYWQEIERKGYRIND